MRANAELRGDERPADGQEGIHEDQQPSRGDHHHLQCQLQLRGNTAASSGSKCRGSMWLQLSKCIEGTEADYVSVCS